jgi:diguanylate cyclase (GGDEF)-like protein
MEQASRAADAADAAETWKQLLGSWFAHRTGRVTILLGAYALAFTAWVLVGAERLPYRTVISDLAFLPMGLLAAWHTWRVGANRALAGRARLAWRLISLALLAYTAGDAIWSYYELRLGTEPFPSPADAGYLLFYPLMLAGLLAFPHAPVGRSAQIKFWLDITTVLLGGWMIVWYFVLGPTALVADADPTVVVLSTAYPIGDLILVFGTAALLLRQPGGSSRLAFGILGGGIVCFLVADLSFGYLSLLEAYEAGSGPDIYWMLAPWFIAAAAQFQNWRASLTPAVERRETEEMESVSPLPYVAVVLGYALLFVAGRYAAPYPLGGLLYGAIAITAFVLFRQIAVMNENIGLIAQVRTLASTDGLTGLVNRRQFYVLAQREFARYQRYHHPLSAVMLDVDNFKGINDRYGHLTGDQVLQTVAEHCRLRLRAVDLLARYGGDELIVLLPETDLAAASQIAQRLLQTVQHSPLPAGADLLKITLSAGVATADGAPDLPALLRRADEALLQAKQGGRNLMVASGPA